MTASVQDLAAVCSDVRAGQPSDAVAGACPALVARPADVDEAAALMRAAASADLAVVPRGRGGRLRWGRPPGRCDLVVDTTLMNHITEHAAGDLVARVQAGATMGDVAAALAQTGQQIALDAPPDATIGGVVASGLAGPRRLRFGTPRDLLIGITIVRADGAVAHSGGKVVKNVAGYDLGKLFAGSAGTLGLITDATFRLHPLPAARAFVSREFDSVAEAAAAVAAAASSPLVPSAVEISRPPGEATGPGTPTAGATRPGSPVTVGVLLEGTADGVAARSVAMAGLLGSPPAAITDSAPAWWNQVPDPCTAAGTLVRVSFWVSALGQVLDATDHAARAAGVAAVVGGSAGAGVLYASLAEPPEAAAAFVSGLRAALGGPRCTVTVLSAPAGFAAGMLGPVPSLHLMRAVKDQFDPGHRMSPGRLAEGI